MRIISGIHKGRYITAPKKLPVRPTTDMAKEALFNILNNRFYFDEIEVIDLFSGTGNISYEFASRGVPQITAVDAHVGCVKFIDITSKQLGFNIKPFKSDVFPFLKRSPQKADIIFADPPYDMHLSDFSNISNLVFANKLLKKEGVLVIEHSKHTNLSEVQYYTNERKYGGSTFSFFDA